LRYIMLIFWLILVVIGVGFSSANAYSVKLNLYVSSISVYLPLLLLLVLAIGFLLGTLSMIAPLLKSKVMNRQLRKQLKVKSEEINQLQRLSMDDSLIAQ
jgi:uncharacterized membrane protein YciS (DUF1049 family)